MTFHSLPEALFTTPEMAAIWSGEAMVRRMLDFEAALAVAEARAGVIPAVAAEGIASACQVELFAGDTIWREAAATGTPVIPLVQMIAERATGSAKDFVHWGATSQDVIDTSLVLQMRDGLDLLDEELAGIAEECAALAEKHRSTLMAGRTLLQQAMPITFGLKAARWLALVTRQALRLRELSTRIAVVQFGGAVGTLAALGNEGMQVTELLATELGLAVPDLPWPTERDRIAEVAAGLGVVAGAMGKIAGDIVLLAQSEVAEVAEEQVAGKGSSSAMPHKQNPIDAVMARAAADLAIQCVPLMLSAMPQEHERAAGAWQVEWAALPKLFGYTAAAVTRVRAAVGGLVIDAKKMRQNLEQSGGLVMSEAVALALIPTLGRSKAQQLVRELAERARQTGTTFQAAALADVQVRSVLSDDMAKEIFLPGAYLGSTDRYIDRALAEFRQLKAERQSNERDG